MGESRKTERIAVYNRLCRELGERCTAQRRVILDAVLDLENHPAADEVFELVSARLPNISKPTVYRTLEHLVRLGVITKACHPGSVARFDTRIDIHHHLVCLQCNRFFDFENVGLNDLLIPDTSELGFEVSDYRVQLRGICSSCRERKTKEEPT